MSVAAAPSVDAGALAGGLERQMGAATLRPCLFLSSPLAAGSTQEHQPHHGCNGLPVPAPLPPQLATGSLGVRGRGRASRDGGSCSAGPSSASGSLATFVCIAPAGPHAAGRRPAASPPSTSAASTSCSTAPVSISVGPSTRSSIAPAPVALGHLSLGEIQACSDGTDIPRHQTHLHASSSATGGKGAAPRHTGAAADLRQSSILNGRHTSSGDGGISHAKVHANDLGGLRVRVHGSASAASLPRPGAPSSPSLLPLPGSSALGSTGGSTSSGSGPAVARRPGCGVKTSQITSQITAAQRRRAATIIQAAWRCFRIRRLYLRLIVWRLGQLNSGQEEGSGGLLYFALRRFLPPAPPELPDVSLFSTCGRPAAFRGLQRREWFGMELPPRRRGAPPMRLGVPHGAEVDVAMSEVERILGGGFWRDEPPPAERAGGGAGEVGLSMYMQAKMKAEEREAEEALQMLSYEPHDLMHVLGSLKERTLEKLGSLGRTIGGALLNARGSSSGTTGGGGGLGSAASGGGECIGGNRLLGRASSSRGLLFGSLPHHHTAGARSQQHSQQQSSLLQPLLSSGGGYPVGLIASAADLAGPSGSGGQQRPQLPPLHPHGGYGHLGDWELHIPQLTVVDARGNSHTEVPPGAAAVPIAVNRQRYRNRSHVTRMSL